MLTLPEKWILLTLDEKSGKTKIPRSALECGITAGMLMELAIAGRIELMEGKKIKVLDTSQMDNPLIDKALGLMVKAKKSQTVLNWMIHLTIQDSQVVESFFFKHMVAQSILKKEKNKVLGIFNSKGYFPVSEVIRNETLESLAEIIRMKHPKESSSLYLLGLVAHCGYSEKILGIKQAALLSKNSLTIFSNLEDEHFPKRFIPFFFSTLEALTLSQQSAGAY
jgi:hypothetical protein